MSETRLGPTPVWFWSQGCFYPTVKSTGNQLWTLWNMSLFCLFCEGLGLGIRTYLQDGKEKLEKSLGGDTHNHNLQVMQPPPCVPQLFRHNAPMCVTALEWLGFSPEHISHQTGEEWRAYSLILNQENGNHHWMSQWFSHVRSYTSEFWIVQLSMNF